MKIRLNGTNSVSVTGSTRSITGSPLAGASSGLPGVARMSGADPDRPPCQMVPIPTYAAAITSRMSAFGLRRARNGTKSADATTLSAQFM